MTVPKLFEVRDRGTTIPVMGVLVSADDGPLMRHAGFGGGPMVYLVQLTAQRCAYDVYHWGWSPRTMRVAHGYVEAHWADLTSGAVVDVEWILGETRTPKLSDVRLAEDVTGNV